MKNISTSSRPQSFFYSLATGILIMHIPGFPSVLRTPVTVLFALLLIFVTYQVFSNKKVGAFVEKKAETTSGAAIKAPAESTTKVVAETATENEPMGAEPAEGQGESKTEQQNV